MIPLALAVLALAPLPRVEDDAFDSNGVEIHFTLQGEGAEPLVLLHNPRAQDGGSAITIPWAARARKPQRSGPASP